MSHITGLFSRRGYNLEGIVCAPYGGKLKSRMYLLVQDRSRLEQIIKQLEKLYDVDEVKIKKDYDHTLFEKLHGFIQSESTLTA